MTKDDEKLGAALSDLIDLMRSNGVSENQIIDSIPELELLLRGLCFELAGHSCDGFYQQRLRRCAMADNRVMH